MEQITNLFKFSSVWLLCDNHIKKAKLLKRVVNLLNANLSLNFILSETFLCALIKKRESQKLCGIQRCDKSSRTGEPTKNSTRRNQDLRKKKLFRKCGKKVSLSKKRLV